MSDELDKLAAQGDALAAESAAANNPVPAAPGGEVATTDGPKITNAQGCAMALQALREFLVNVLDVKSATATLADDKVAKAAEAIAPVLDKYGVNLGKLGGGVEVSAIVVAGPILWAAFRATMAELAMKKPERLGKAETVDRVVNFADAVESLQGGPNG